MEKALLEQFSKTISNKKVLEFYNTLALPIIADALDVVSKKIEVINPDCIRIFPIGDYTNGTFIDETGGELEIVIACSNPQLQITNKSFVKEYSEATKKQKPQINIKNTSEDIIKTLYKALVEQFSEQTTLVLFAQGIKILCKEEIGFNMLIRFATYNENDKDFIMSFWNTIKKQSEPVDVYGYAEEIEKKNLITKGNFAIMTRILKSYRKTMLAKKWISANASTRYLVEAIVYNIPAKLLATKDFTTAYTKSMLYLQNCPVNTFKSFNGRPINECNLVKANFNAVRSFLNNLIKLDA